MDFKKYFKLKKNFKKKKPDPDPILYWEIILSIFFILFFAGLTFGTILFLQVGKDIEIKTPESTTTKVIDKEKLNAVLKHFSDRAKKSEAIKTSPAPVSDPSI